MLRTFSYPLHPTRAQAAVLESWLSTTCFIYNCALEHRRLSWRQGRRSVTRYDQYKELTQIRKEDQEIQALPLRVARGPLNTLDRSFQAFFRRVKAGETPGYPRFKGADRYRTLDLGDAFRVEENRIHIPKMGPVRFNRYRDLDGQPRIATLTKKAGKWWVSVVCEVGPSPPKVPVEEALTSAIGVDLGLDSFLVGSDGRKVVNPRFFRNTQAKLADHQRRLQTKRRGSKNRGKAKLQVARAYLKVRNQRLDFARKTASELLTSHKMVVHEDLNVRGMVQNSNLAKSISDAGWSTFIHCLTAKAENAGLWVVAVDPWGTSQVCSGCGLTVRKDSLSVRVHRCDPGCGLVLDRDHNAALNILALGRSAVVGQSGTLRPTQKGKHGPGVEIPLVQGGPLPIVPKAGKVLVSPCDW